MKVEEFNGRALYDSVVKAIFAGANLIQAETELWSLLMLKLERRGNDFGMASSFVVYDAMFAPKAPLFARFKTAENGS